MNAKMRRMSRRRQKKALYKKVQKFKSTFFMKRQTFKDFLYFTECFGRPILKNPDGF